MTPPSTARHRVVIVGSGFGGLFAAKSLARVPDAVEVSLVSRTNHHLFQPLLYQVATGILSEGQIAPATRDVLKKKNVSVELAEVTGFDLKARHVIAATPDGRNVSLSYDSLIVAAGAGQSYFGRDEYSKWAPGMKTLADALEHRARIFGAFEMAELEDDPEIRRAWLTFVVIGGGPTGVEIAGQIAELSRRSLKHEFRRFDPGEARVLLFDGGPEILATFGDKLSMKATRQLEKIGVEIHVDSIVTHLDVEGVDVKGPGGSVQHFSAKTKIWGRWRLGIAAGEDACGRHGRSTRQGWPHQGGTRLLAPRPSGGVRSRRHDELQRSPRSCRGCSSVRPPCRARHQKPSPKPLRADSLEVLGLREHGRGGPPQRRSQRAWGEADRPNRVAGLAGRAYFFHDGVREPVHGSLPLVPVACRHRPLRTANRRRRRPIARPRFSTLAARVEILEEREMGHAGHAAAFSDSLAAFSCRDVPTKITRSRSIASSVTN